MLLVYGIGLAAATFIEKYQGSEVARSMVYCSPLFFLLQFLLVLNWLAVAIRQHSLKMRKWGMLVTHGAFIIILLGALVSHLYGEEGILHLREGETSNRFAVRHTGGVTYHTLPFSVELMNFTLTRYPGSSSPSAYESELLVHMDEEVISGRVYMNNVLDVKGYRFFKLLMTRMNRAQCSPSTVMWQGVLSLIPDTLFCCSDWFYALWTSVRGLCSSVAG